MRHLAGIGIAAALFATPAFADDLPAPTPVEAWSLERIVSIGREIHRHDIAAWVATDALFEQTGGVPPDLGGWIVTPQDDGLVVRFIRIEGENFRPGWDILVLNGEAGSVVTATDTAFSDEEQAQFQARQTAIANIGSLRCSNRMNTVVLKDPDSEGWLVWLLAATTENNVIPVGGHYRFRISADGRTMLMRDQLSNSCLTLSTQPEDGGSPVGLVMTQIVSDTPVETHVFLSLLHGMTLYVATAGDLYRVAGDRITVQDLPPRP